MYCKRYSLRNLFPSVQSCPMRRHVGDVGFRGRPLERWWGVDFQLGIFLRNLKVFFFAFLLHEVFSFVFLWANRNPPRPLRFWIPCKVRFCHAVPAKKNPRSTRPWTISEGELSPTHILFFEWDHMNDNNGYLLLVLQNTCTNLHWYALSKSLTCQNKLNNLFWHKLTACTARNYEPIYT